MDDDDEALVQRIRRIQGVIAAQRRTRSPEPTPALGIAGLASIRAIADQHDIRHYLAMRRYRRRATEETRALRPADAVTSHPISAAFRAELATIRRLAAAHPDATRKRLQTRRRHQADA